MVALAYGSLGGADMMSRIVGAVAFLVLATVLFASYAPAQESPTKRCSQRCSDVYASCLAARGQGPKTFNPACADQQKRCRQKCPEGGTPGSAGKPSGPISPTQDCLLQCKNAHMKCFADHTYSGPIKTTPEARKRGDEGRHRLCDPKLKACRRTCR